MFTVQIPFGYTHLPADNVIHQKEASTVSSSPKYLMDSSWWIPTDLPSASSISDAIPSVPKSYKILLVDDNADMRDYIVRLICTYIALLYCSIFSSLLQCGNG